MPEYHPPPSETRTVAGSNERYKKVTGPHDDSTHSHTSPAVVGERVDDNMWTEDAGSGYAQTPEQIEKAGAIDAGLEGRQDFETLKGLTDIQLETYLQSEFDIGEDKMQYIEGFQEKPFDFLDTAQGIAEDEATRTRDIAMRESMDFYGDTTTTLGYQKEDAFTTLGYQKEDALAGLESQEETLGRTASRGAGSARAAARSAQSRSGFAGQGSVTSQMSDQLRNITQDTMAGMQDIGRGRASTKRDYDFGMKTAGRDYDFGMKTAGREMTQGIGDAFGAHELAGRSSDLAHDQGTYAEQQRQLDELYADVAAIPS
mgnify:CR=1 FL=1